MCIRDSLKSKLVNSSIRNFADGEIYIELNENIRGNSIFIIQSISSPANDNLMELFIICDALKRGSANSVNVVMPYYGYQRQDRKDYSRAPISAKVVASCLELHYQYYKNVNSKNILGQENLKGPHYQFEVGSLELFEEKLEKARNKGINFRLEFITIENRWHDTLIGFLPIIIIKITF